MPLPLFAQRKQRMSWTDERVEKLRKLWGDGLSASQCALQLGMPWMSRNAVIGKVTRLGLPGRKVKVRRPAYDRWNTEDRRMTRGDKPFKQARKTAKPKPDWRAEPLPETPAADVVRVTSVLDLEPHHCRWPVGDPKHAGFGYCGCKKVEGLPYCNAHARRAYAPIVPKPSTGGRPINPKGDVGQFIRADIQSHKAVEEFTSA